MEPLTNLLLKEIHFLYGQMERHEKLKAELMKAYLDASISDECVGELFNVYMGLPPKFNRAILKTV